MKKKPIFLKKNWIFLGEEWDTCIVELEPESRFVLCHRGHYIYCTSTWNVSGLQLNQVYRPVDFVGSEITTKSLTVYNLFSHIICNLAYSLELMSSYMCTVWTIITIITIIILNSCWSYITKEPLKTINFI